MAELANHKPRIARADAKASASAAELARGFTTELIRWRGGMTSEAVVAEAFALARAFKAEEEKDQ